MGKKGAKSLRGKAETNWGEKKQAQLKAALTPTGKMLLDQLAAELGRSFADLLERAARGLPAFPVAHSLPMLVDRCWDVLSKQTCIAESRLVELKNGSPITEVEIAKIAQALNVDEAFIEGISRVSGITPTTATPGALGREENLHFDPVDSSNQIGR